MSTHTLTSMADALGVPAVTETADGVRMNAAGRLACAGSPEGFAAAVSMIVGVGADDPGVLEAVAAARNDGAFEGRLAESRVVISRGSDGWLFGAMHGTGAGEDLGSLRRRAAAADLAAGVSHEVANALSAIVGWAELATERPDAADPTETLELIRGSASAALEVARDLLRQVREGPRPVGDARTDASRIASDIARLLRPQAQRKSVRVEAPPGRPTWTAATRGELFTIVWNLAHNAVEVLEPGGTVSIATHCEEGQVRIVVRDDGPGMDAQQSARAFDPYFATRASGTGLGLPLVLRTAVSLGGEVSVDTEPGRGAAFEVLLPAAAVRRPPESGVRHGRIGSLVEPSGSGAAVLVVEDDDGLRGLISTTLEIRGFDVTALASVAAAKGIEGHFDVALVDLTLADGRGDTVVAWLRSRGAVDRVVLMSGGPQPAELAENALPDGWLRKPFEPAELMGVLGHVLGNEEASAGHGRPVPAQR